jgi:23S rRNA pseudouridine1911/1915/1917 synthase
LWFKIFFSPPYINVKESVIHITVPAGKKKERIDVFLTHQIENASRSKVQQAIRNGKVLIDGKTVKPNHILSPGEQITVSLPKQAQPEAVPENIPLDIVYDDDSLIIINKQAGMVTHPAQGNYSGTLVNALLSYLRTKQKSPDSLADIGDPLRPGIIHRLDKDTSGLLVIAKDETAHRFIANQFSRRSIDREYWALVWGVLKEPTGTIEANLGRSVSDRKKISVREDGKHAVTSYEVIEEYDNISLVKLKLYTGRTHQIRVHCASIHHPVFGDPTYGGRRIVYGGVTPRRKAFIANLLELMPRQALHAKTLGFVHPVSREKVNFDSELPDDMKAVIERLSKNKKDYS